MPKILVYLLLFITCLPAIGQFPGAFDLNFDPFRQTSFQVGPNDQVFTTLIQPDGKIWLGGAFTQFRGQPANRLVRLLPNADPDPDFEPLEGANNSIWALALQKDGRLLVGGRFTRIEGKSIPYLMRLMPDGSPDETFRPISGPNQEVRNIQVQPDGRIVICGNFTEYDGVSRVRVARLLPNGRLDPSFQVGTGASWFCRSIQIQPDGKILVGGDFSTFNGQNRMRIVRLNPNGSVDPSFDPGAGANSLVYAVSLEPSGKIFISGHFTEYNEAPHRRLCRLKPDGKLDSTFYANWQNQTIYSIAQTGDGRIVVGGDFPGKIRRVLSNGRLDSLQPAESFTGNIWSLSIDKQGRTIAGGTWGNYRTNLLRLRTDMQVDPTFPNVGGGGNAVSYAQELPDGRIFIGGSFLRVQSHHSPYAAVLFPDGKVDTLFRSGLRLHRDPVPTAFSLDRKGRVLVSFQSQNTDFRIMRLLPDGRIDTSFRRPVSQGMPLTFSQGNFLSRPDSSYWVGGPVGGLKRVFENGVVDTAFPALPPGMQLSAIGRGFFELPDGHIFWTGLYRLGSFPYRCGVWLKPDGQLWLDQMKRIRLGESNASQMQATVQHRQGLILAGRDLRLYDSTNHPMGATQRLLRLLPDSSGFWGVDSIWQSSPFNQINPNEGITFPGFSSDTLGRILLQRNQFGTSNPINRLLPNGLLDSAFPDLVVNLASSSSNSLYSLRSGHFLHFGSNFPQFKRFRGDSSQSLPDPVARSRKVGGAVFQSQSAFCLDTSLRRRLPDRVLSLEPGGYLATSSRSGRFSFLPDSGRYALDIQPLQSPFPADRKRCPHPDSVRRVSVPAPLGTYLNESFGLELLPFAQPQVQIEGRERKPCSAGTTRIQIQNRGMGPAPAQGLRVQASPELFLRFEPGEASLWADSSWWVPVPELQPGERFSVFVHDSVACLVPASRSLCVKARLSPRLRCLPPVPGWDGSDIQVEGLCSENRPWFRVRNEGTDMASPRMVRLFADSLLVWERTAWLAAGDSVLVVPEGTPGRRYRLEWQQDSLHPQRSWASAVSACGPLRGDSWFSAPDAGWHEACDCRSAAEKASSFVKAAIPGGQGEEKIIPSSTVLEYRIPFANVLPERALSVEVTDSLDPALDIRGLEALTGSHFTQMRLEGTREKPVLRFRLLSAVLPPQSQDSLGSRAWVGFRIPLKNGLSPGTIVRNRAQIWLNGQAFPTSETRHRVDTLPLEEEEIDSVRIQAFPRIWHRGLADTLVCTGQDIRLPVRMKGSFLPGNRFSLELSNAAGEFTNPLLLRTWDLIRADTLVAPIPQNLPGGGAYRLRIRSSWPPSISADTAAPFALVPGPQILVTATPASACPGTWVQLAATGASSYSWEPALPANLRWFLTDTTRFRVLGHSGTCTDTALLQLAPLPLPVLSYFWQPSDTVCLGDSVRLMVSGGDSVWLSQGQNNAYFFPQTSDTLTVRAWNAEGCADTLFLPLVVRICTGVNARFREAAIRVFPNPARRTIWVESDRSLRLLWRTVQGRVLGEWAQPSGRSSVSLDDLPSGLYFLEEVQGTWRAKVQVVR